MGRVALGAIFTESWQITTVILAQSVALGMVIHLALIYPSITGPPTSESMHFHQGIPSKVSPLPG